MAARSGSSVKVVVVRTGGVAGARREWRLTARGDDVESIVAVVESVAWETAAIDPASRDRFVWSIAVTGAARHRAKVPDSQLTGPWRELVHRVQADGEEVAPERRARPAAEHAG